MHGMPELPEVEIFKRFAERHALGRPIADVAVLHPKILDGTTAAALARTVKGQVLDEARRHGKHLFLHVKKPDRWLVLHFGMTGFLVWYTDDTCVTTAYGDTKSRNGHLRIRFDLEDGSHFGFDEQRMFGKLSVIDDPDAYIEALHLGPDALGVDLKTFKAGLLNRKGALKPALMDQGLVAGVGNVYADETLFQCRLHPELKIGELNPEDLRCLHRAMRTVLQKTVDCRADRDQLPEGYLTHHRHKNGRCPRDRTRLEIRTVGGRTTYFCPACQRL